MDAETNNQKDPNDLMNTFEELSAKNLELQELLHLVCKENTASKRKYYDFEGQLDKLNAALAKNVQIFHQLYDDTKSALEMGRISTLRSPVQKKIVINNNTPPGPSTKCVTHPVSNDNIRNITRRKFHIEPMNLEEMRREIEEASNQERVVEEEEPVSILEREKLSTILEEFSSTSNCTVSSNVKEVIINVERLPLDIVEYHLKKSTSNPSLNITDSFNMTDEPNFSSTPLKLELMDRLGLMPITRPPINSSHIYVSKRKKNTQSQNRNNINFAKKEQLSLSPENVASRGRTSQLKKERVSIPSRTSGNFRSSRSLPKSPIHVGKRKKTNPEVKKDLSSPESQPRQRPQRAAKPLLMKEPTLKKKMRRS